LTFFCEDFQAFKRLCLFWRGLHWSTSLLLLLFFTYVLVAASIGSATGS
jgi:hypothetical protein